MRGNSDWVDRIAVSSIFLANGFAVGAWVSRIPAVQQRLSLSPAVLGVVLLASAVGALVSMTLSGWLSERVGNARIVAGSVVLVGLAMALLGKAPSMAALAGALLLFGLGGGAMDVAMNAEAVRVEQRFGRSIMSSFHGLWSTGAMAGAALGSLATAHEAGLFAFLGSVGVGVVLIGLTSTAFLPPSLQSIAVEKSPIFVVPPRALIGVAVIAGCAYLSEGAIGDWNALFLIREEHVRAALATGGFAAFSMAMAVGRFAGDGVIRRFGPVSTVRVGALCAAVSLAIELAVGRPWAVFPSLIVIGLSFAAIVPVAFSAAGNAVGISPSRGLAAVATAGYVGFLAGPPLIGFVAELVHLRWALVIVVALCLTAAAFARSVGRRE